MQQSHPVFINKEKDIQTKRRLRPNLLMKENSKYKRNKSDNPKYQDKWKIMYIVTALVRWEEELTKPNTIATLDRNRSQQ